MNTANDNPQTLVEAIRYFADPDQTLAFMVKLRWPDGVACPTCGRTDVKFLANQRRWQCKSVHAKRQFSVKVGTIFEDSALPLEKWLTAVWMIANAKNGVSSYEIHRSIGVTQKTAWFVLHRIRLAMKTGSFTTKLGGEVESDETFIGGAFKNMHKHKRDQMPKGRGSIGKAIVQGLIERGGEVRCKVVPNQKRKTLQATIRENVQPGAAVYTDTFKSYNGLSADFIHAMVDHAVEYVNGRVHTNGMENFWSLLKRTLDGTYVAVEPFHLDRYLDEQSFRFNSRKTDDGARFNKVLESITGKRLTYRSLIGDSSTTPPSIQG